MTATGTRFVSPSAPPVAAADDIRAAYERYGPALLRKAERILGSSDDAEDVVHALFVDLHGSRRTSRAADLPYLYRAVTNRCLNIIRDSRRRRQLLEQRQVPLATPRLDRRALDVDLLARLIDRLDRGATEVLVCRYIDEMTQAEIAEHLSTSRKTVGKRLARIREVLEAIAGEGAA